MGINRLLIDSRISGFWHGHTKTGQERRRDREERAGHTAGPGTRDASLQRHVQWRLLRQSARWLSALGGHPSTSPPSSRVVMLSHAPGSRDRQIASKTSVLSDR